jgi:hypothetical protein
VKHGANGLLLSEVTGQAIAEAISGLLEKPGVLSKMSQSAIERSGQFRPQVILKELETCLDEPSYMDLSRAKPTTVLPDGGARARAGDD